MSERPSTIHFVSLGCPKNRVDTEVMLGVAQRAGYVHVKNPADARVIVVNTCGFIDAAKQESIETVLTLSEHKKHGSCKKVVVAGCLSQRYQHELAEGMPEVDHFMGSSDMLKLESVLTGNAKRLMVGHPAQWVVSAADPRTISTRGASAYLKIAEGCNRTCSFCVIPKLRGKQRSRAPADVVDEARRLADAGVLEVNLVAQDTVAYGRELDDQPRLAELVEQIAEIDGLRWVRLFYLYPENLDEHLLELLGQHERVLPYVDMPLQHAADGMLRRMRRGHGGQRLRDVVERLRRAIDELVFRTAFIVGHPGETDEEFDELLRFVEWAEFDRVGVFRYSDEEEAHSFDLPAKVPKEIADRRLSRLLSLQRRISKKKNRALIGKRLEVLVEGPSTESEFVMVGRHRGQAPEIDGVVYLSGGEALPGQMLLVDIEQATDYDLVGDLSHTETTLANERPRVARREYSVHENSDGRRVRLRTVT